MFPQLCLVLGITGAAHRVLPAVPLQARPAVSLRRATEPRAALVTFNSECIVQSDAFEADIEGLRRWFASPESIEILCSMADEFRELTPDSIEVVSRIPFPGMVAKSVTVLQVEKDLNAPSFNISTLSSKTVCESGPQWVRDLFVRILDSTKSTSSNRVTIQWSDGMACVQSEVGLRVEINFPGFIPLPVGAMQREGSKSLQQVLDQQISPILQKFREQYLKRQLPKNKITNGTEP